MGQIVTGNLAPQYRHHQPNCSTWRSDVT